jgi:hypothetical protein
MGDVVPEVVLVSGLLESLQAASDRARLNNVTVVSFFMIQSFNVAYFS